MPQAPAQGAQPKIEDYALLGDLRTAALVEQARLGRLAVLPRFDSPACFAALLGTPENGRWLLAPGGRIDAASSAATATPPWCWRPITRCPAARCG